MTEAGVDSWYHEKESAWLYRRVAAAEADPAKSALFLKLAAAAEMASAGSSHPRGAAGLAVGSAGSKKNVRACELRAMPSTVTSPAGLWKAMRAGGSACV